jgi:hypothetical protein
METVPTAPPARVDHGADPDVFDYGLWYVEQVGTRMGRPQMVLPPRSLPAGWGRPD